MIKTVKKLICDHCGREIAEDEQYITESTCLTLYRWDGNLGILDEEQPSEHSTRDLCALCYCNLKLFGNADSKEQQTPVEDRKAENESSAAAAEEPQAVTVEASPEFRTACAKLAERSEAFVRAMGSPEKNEAEPETGTESATIAEDVATGETVELDGKTYTEYQPEPAKPEPITRKSEAPEPPLEAREAAARILAMAEKKPRKRLTREQKEQITKRMKQGKSCAKVGEELGIPAQTVWNVWHKYKEEHDGK